VARRSAKRAGGTRHGPPKGGHYMRFLARAVPVGYFLRSAGQFKIALSVPASASGSRRTNRNF